MQSMKKLLSAFAALSFVTVAGISTVACNSCNTDKGKASASMDAKVLEDLGLFDKDGKSLVEAKLTVTDATASWGSDQLSGITASKLLNPENKAKTESSFNFLTGVLKLEATGDGAWDAKTFDKAKADKITLTSVSVNPTLKAITDDYAISGGKAEVQWKQDNTNLGTQYGVDLKANEKVGVVKANLPTQLSLTEDFDTTKGPLAGFAIGKPKSGITNGTDVTSNFKTDSEKGKQVKAIADKIGQALKVTIEEVNSPGPDFDSGDSLKLKISLGEVKFSTEYTLTLA